MTGNTAVGVDVSNKLTRALPTYLLVVIGLSFLLLLLAFRSILVPLKATLGFLLTIGATFGITVGVFQKGWGAELLGVDSPGPLVSFLPIIMMGVLFGLAMDYEVFIVSRVREEFVHGRHATEATIEGVGHGARVVTAAALIMAAVFAGFILVEDPIIKTIGFGLPDHPEGRHRGREPPGQPAAAGREGARQHRLTAIVRPGDRRPGPDYRQLISL